MSGYTLAACYCLRSWAQQKTSITVQLAATGGASEVNGNMTATAMQSAAGLVPGEHELQLHIDAAQHKDIYSSHMLCCCTSTEKQSDATCSCIDASCPSSTYTQLQHPDAERQHNCDVPQS